MAKISENSIKVLNFLKDNHGKKMTSAEVAEALDLTTAQVNGTFTALSNKELGYREEATVKGAVDISFLAITDEGKTADVSEISENGQKIAEFLSENEKVAWVKYGGLKGDKYYELAKKYMPHGAPGVVSFGVKGGRKAAEAFMKKLEVFAIETHVADARSCCLHPASATHRQMNDEELLAAGVLPELVRLSCGLESAEDLIADLDRALKG